MNKILIQMESQKKSRPLKIIQFFFIILGLFTSLTTLIGFFGHGSWILDLFSHFRVQYALILFLSTLIVWFSPYRFFSWIFLISLYLNLNQIYPFYFGQSPQPPSDKNQDYLKVVSFNLHTQNKNHDPVIELIEKEQPHLVILMETNDQWIHHLSSLKSNYPHFIAEPREDNFGISVFSQRPFVDSKISWIGKNCPPSITVKIKHNNKNITIIATHPLPPVDEGCFILRNHQLSELSKIAQSIQEPLLLLGDLNSTPFSVHFKQLMMDSGLNDSAIGKGIIPTWPTSHPFMLIPIDHCLHSNHIQIKKRKRGPSCGSDHYPLIIEFWVSPTHQDFHEKHCPHC